MAATWAAAAVVCVLWSGGARANEFDQFQNARAAYDSLNYELAADLFSGLLEDAAESDQRPLVLESRKYLAAAYLFLGRVEHGERQLELLLRADPNYVLDPLAFPREVHAAFARVSERLEREGEELAAERERMAAERDAERLADDKTRRQRLRRLTELAETERVQHLRSRWIAMLPFGIGQFQNGDDGLGLALAVSETALLTAGVTLYVLHQDLPTNPAAQDEDTVKALEPVYRIGNQVSMALFAVVAVTGIMDAQIRFKESFSEDRKRPLPPDLQHLDRASLSIGPGALSFRYRF
jgi:tetratricopeptide (TPR) repeat protein